MKAYWKMEVWLQTFLISALDGIEWSALRPGRFIPLRKNRWYPLDRKLIGPQSQSGCGGEEKNSQPLPGLEPPIMQPVVQRRTTELHRLLILKIIAAKVKL
jgi:hypothetical protein